MNEPYMTMAEIEAKYPNEWVLLGNPTTKRGSLTPTGGYVIIHCTDRAEYYQRFEQWTGNPAIIRLASWHTGNDGSGIGMMLPPDAEPGAA